LKKTESAKNLQDISADLVVPYDNTIEKEDDDKDSTEILEFHCDID